MTFAALFATAYAIDARYDQGAWPWIGATAIGTAVAAERVAAGRHFYTDVMVGALADGGAMLAWSGKLWQVPSGGARSKVGPCMRRAFTGS